MNRSLKVDLSPSSTILCAQGAYCARHDDQSSSRAITVVKKKFRFRPGTLVTDQTGDTGYSPQASSRDQGGPCDAVGEDRLDVRTVEVRHSVPGVRGQLQ